MRDRYIVAKCPRCKTLMIADFRYKSKTCPKCNRRVLLEDLKVLSGARDSREARSILLDLKADRRGLDQT